MKRHGNLWEQIISIENLELAHKNARKGKAYYKEVQMVDADPLYHIALLRRLLRLGEFTTSAYRIKEIFDGKKVRTIHKLPYWPDRIVQHALMNIVEPILRRSLIRDTFQSLKGRGTLDAFQRIRNVVMHNPTAKYAVKLDVVKFYPSVNTDILKGKIREKIKCGPTLCLLDNIIDSTKGLPIGNYTSQILGNFYLSELDWFVKQELKPLGYFRYCDDVVILTNTLDAAHKANQEVVRKIASLGLRCKPPIVSYIPNNGVDFVGYLLRAQKSKVRKRICDNFMKNGGPSYKGWFSHNRSLPFFNKHTKDYENAT